MRFLRAECPRHGIVLLGASPEFRLNQELILAAGVEGVINAADDLPIPRLIALLERAAGLVSVDSGPAHAAAAVGCPQVVLFGKASPSLYRPWGAAGAAVNVLRGEIDGEASMLGIAAESVMDAWSTLPLRGSLQG
jgi:heptosyltransferase-2/heptosyltransferase-3